MFDVDALAARQAPEHYIAVKESVDEFARELHGYIERHPFIEGCNLAEKAEP